MADDVMTIREMCDAFDVTPRTLRFYESKELLAPHREGNRRLYSRRDRARLKLILRGKRLGFSLNEIRIYCIAIILIRNTNAPINKATNIILF